MEQRIADRKEGVQEASVLAREIAQGEASFDRRWKDKRIVVSGYVNTLERLNDYGYILKFGPSSPSLIPKDNLQAVFYAPSLATPLSHERSFRDERKEEKREEKTTAGKALTLERIHCHRLG